MYSVRHRVDSPPGGETFLLRFRPPFTVPVLHVDVEQYEFLRFVFITGNVDVTGIRDASSLGNNHDFSSRPLRAPVLSETAVSFLRSKLREVLPRHHHRVYIDFLCTFATDWDIIQRRTIHSGYRFRFRCSHFRAPCHCPARGVLQFDLSAVRFGFCQLSRSNAQNGDVSGADRELRIFSTASSSDDISLNSVGGCTTVSLRYLETDCIHAVTPANHHNCTGVDRLHWQRTLRNNKPVKARVEFFGSLTEPPLAPVPTLQSLRHMRNEMLNPDQVTVSTVTKYAHANPHYVVSLSLVPFVIILQSRKQLDFFRKWAKIVGFFADWTGGLLKDHKSCLLEEGKITKTMSLCLWMLIGSVLVCVGEIHTGASDGEHSCII